VVEEQGRRARGRATAHAETRARSVRGAKSAGNADTIFSAGALQAVADVTVDEEEVVLPNRFKEKTSCCPLNHCIVFRRDPAWRKSRLD
jgi:hypothetical protein